MELITGATNERFRIIIPYSARQVSSSLDMEGYSGREFIAKRIPVTFSVPPLITAGWQNAFKTMWTQTVTESDESSCIEVIQLIERWRPLQYPRIIPRLLKKLVNDIYTLNLTVPGTSSDEKLRFVLIALYILMVKYGDIDIRTLLRNPFQNEENKPQAPEEQDDKLKANYAQLKRIFINDENRWSEFLMSVHYQAAAELARSELIDTPLVEAVKAKDADALERLVTMWGFAHAWNRCAARMDMTAWLETVANLPQPILSLVKQKIEYSIQDLNSNYAVNNKEDFNLSFNISLIRLINENSIGIEDFMKNQRNFIILALDELESVSDNSNREITNLLTEANQYSLIFGSSLFNDMEYAIPGSIYIHYLIENEEKWNGLKIKDMTFSDESIEDIIISALNEHNIDIFNHNIIRLIGSGSKSVYDIINRNEGIPDKIIELANKFSNNLAISDINDFRKLIFTKEWGTINQLNLYNNQTIIKQNHPTEFAAHIIAHMIGINNFSGIESYIENINNTEYEKLLTNYLSFKKSWHGITDALKNENVIPFIKNSISQLFNNGKITRLNPIYYLKNEYLILKENIKDINLMDPIISREHHLINALTIKDLELINEEVIYDLLKTKALSDTHKALHSLSKSLLDASVITDSFKLTSTNIKIILEHMKDQGEKIFISPDINSFAEWYRSTLPSELSQKNYIRFIWELLDAAQQQEILTQFHDVLLEVQVSRPNRIQLIYDFGDVINFIEPGHGTSRRGIGALFALAENDATLRIWLDQQNYSFSNWPSTELQTTTKYIIEHHELFPRICKSSKYIENRMQELKTKQSSEPTGEISDSDD
ncbi:hypothetical protein [Morganella morganii]|uniref:hypothetical protein n=1 Tax=Morganella morganii TaxID=582 RepID=UPI00301E3C4F